MVALPFSGECEIFAGDTANKHAHLIAILGGLGVEGKHAFGGCANVRWVTNQFRAGKRQGVFIVDADAGGCSNMIPTPCGLPLELGERLGPAHA